MLDHSDGIVLPQPSQAERNIAGASSHHCVAHTVLGNGVGIHTQAESLLELHNLFLLNAMPNVVQLREQVRFYYGWDTKKQKQHIFDAVASLDCGSRIAFAVKPEARLASGRFEAEMQEVAWWVCERGFADEVRIMSEADINPVDLRNAKILASVREIDPEADAVALEVVRGLPPGGGFSLRDLTHSTGLSARGYRSLIRLIRSGVLRLQQHEVIGPKAVVMSAIARGRVVESKDRGGLMIRAFNINDGGPAHRTTA
ncbi:hypothetical protein [Thalassorhabdomicrobium marinisediminis]|uniref:Uncharacterized protein n=1 Tax=Thalassorhabdomicrobium marinisediminis TaxID=2170577 RepID=A0A2T7FSW9_9RHOB|nr:hypothetical protein [Thalassorhabdomicrobium marinisediminis]PVA05270.1 hypothetical protein DC363_15730 [Thalassorhabdomicrobium marinisediminis]